MHIEQTALPGVMILTPKRFEDARGFFSEVYNQSVMSDHGIDLTFVQDNHSLSRARGVVRGLHFQAPPYAQAKLVRVGAGRVWDVAVDARRGSPTYGQWTGVELSAENGRQIFIPEGFLHGFATLSENAELLYKCSAPYDGPSDGAVQFADPDLAIDWKVDIPTAVISDKDKAAGSWADFDSPFMYEVPL